jgi:hypothetical protein
LLCLLQQSALTIYPWDLKPLSFFLLISSICEKIINWENFYF